jgi:uncharacterized iron-regulated protein
MVPTRNDPLIGKIYNSANRQEISYQVLLEKSLESTVIYLGENHDNESHHQHQLRILKDFIDRGKRPRIGFEFFSVDQTGTLMSFVTRQKASHAGHSEQFPEAALRKNLGWQDRTDEDWGFYFPFIKLAAENRLTVFGADLPNGIIQRITRNGVDSLTAVEKVFIKTTGFSDEAYRELMFEKFKAAHCGFAQQAIMEKMYQTWLARNDSMAQAIASMVLEASDQPVIVILGKGHVEHNMAVYDRVNHLIPAIKQLNLGFTEISIQLSALQDYFQQVIIGGRTFLPDHDYLWFTQRSSYEDTCEKFHKILSQMKK